MRQFNLFNRMKIFSSLLIFVLFFLPEVFSQVYTWQSKQAFGGTGRSGAVAFSIGTKGYIGTGYDSNPTKDFWEYDPSTDTWAQKADFGGGERNHAAGFSIGSKGYLGTGLRYCMCENTKDFWEYDPATNVWTRKADFAGPSRHVAIGLSIGNKGYIGTGSATNYAPLYKDFWEYDPTADTWTQKADFAGGARYYTSAFSVGKKGYIGTGTDFTGGGFTYRKDFWEYDQNTDTWLRKADFAGTAREGAVGFNINNKGYIGTGYDGSSTYSAKDFWEYDNLLDSWTRKADFGGGERFSSAGFSIGSTGYIGVGVAGARVNDFWAYTTIDICSIAVTIPDVKVLNYSSIAYNTVYPPYAPASSITLTAQPSGTSPYTYSWSNGATTQSITVSPLSNTTYAVTVTDASGCTGTASKEVIVKNVNCNNGKVYMCHITGNSNHVNTVCIDNSAVATHLAAGCSLGECVGSRNAPSAIETEVADFKIDIIPNPSSNYFSLVINTKEPSPVSIRIMDVLGRVVEVKNNMAVSEKYTFGNALKPGVYLAEIIQGKNRKVIRLVKK
jgi:hypothetical protein